MLNDKLLLIQAPSHIALQCVEPAESGGDTLIIDSQDILTDIHKDDLELYQFLLEEKSIAFYGGHEFSGFTQIVSKLKNGKFKINFRLDLALIKEKFQERIEYFLEKYILNKKYQKQFILQRNEILIIDNFRCLHGRTNIFDKSDKRHLRRVWIWDCLHNEEIQPLREMNNILYNSEISMYYSNYAPIGPDSNLRSDLNRGLKT